MSAHTERTVLNALRARHAVKHGNGPEWAYIEHVRNAAGFNASRTLDAMALHLWPSRGMELHGYEVKVSRSDFRRELADPAKMDAFANILDRFWIVAPRGVVPAEEIPASWGLLEVLDDGTIRQKIAAPLLTQERAPIPRTMLVPIMRAAGAGLEVTPDIAAVREAEERGVQKGLDQAKRSGKDWQAMYEGQVDQLAAARNQVRAIEDALGISLRGHAYLPEERDARLREIAAAVKAAVNGDDVAARGRRAIDTALDSIRHTIASLERQAEIIARDAGDRQGATL
jgi:hypothetical protein